MGGRPCAPRDSRFRRTVKRGIRPEGRFDSVADPAVSAAEILDRAAWAVFISTPHGRNWFFDMHTRGTGAGDPIFDDLAPRIPGLVPFKFSNASKAELVQWLGVGIEQRMVSWPAEWTILTDELNRYEYALTPGGRYTYDALSGFHDDCVTALALAYSRRTQPGLAITLSRPFHPPQLGRRTWARPVLALP